MELFNIYEDEYYIVRQSEEYKIPGFYVITEKNERWDSSFESINRLAAIEKKIRDSLLDMGMELVGIYREQTPENGFRVMLIPYHVNILKELGISPELYQPKIETYLKGFPPSQTENISEVNRQMTLKMKKDGELK